jgi:tetratricopeptide (TPR) repeat protein
VLLLAGVIALIAHPRYGSLLAFSLTIRTVHDNVLTQIHGVVYLLSRLVWVHRLNIDPDLPVITHWMPTVAAELIGILSVLTLGLASLRRRPWLAFGILWLFLHLLPTNSIVPRLDVANERSLYLAAWGVCLPFSVTWAMLQDRRPEWVTPVQVGAAVLILVLAGWTLVRNHTYRNEIALWEDTVGKSLRKARAYNNLGYAYFLAGRDEEARASYLMALRLNPEFLLARNNLAALRSDDRK